MQKLQINEYEQFLEEAEQEATIAKEQEEVQLVGRIDTDIVSQQQYQQAVIRASYKATHGHVVEYEEVFTELTVNPLALPQSAENTIKGAEKDEEAYAQKVRERQQKIVEELQNAGFVVKSGKWL